MKDTYSIPVTAFKIGNLSGSDLGVVTVIHVEWPNRAHCPFMASVSVRAMRGCEVIMSVIRFSLSTKSSSGRRCDYVIWRIACSKLKFCGASLTCGSRSTSQR
jgi:hypothetical protein